MSNTGGFYSLIRPVEKREGRLERLRIVSVGANGDTRMGGPPTFKLQPWTTLGVATQTDAHLDVGELVLRDPVLSANFKVRFTARAHIDQSDSSVRNLARAYQTQKGLAGFVEDHVRQAIERWPDAHKNTKGQPPRPVVDSRLLTAITKHGDDAARYVVEQLREIGIRAVEPRLHMVAWHEGRVDIDEKAGIEVRVTDGDPVIVRVASFIDKDEALREAFYTSSLHRYKLAGQGPSISEKVMAALKTGLDGKFSRQDWTANDPKIQTAAKAAMNAVAAVYGRGVQQLILTTSVRKPDEILNFDQTYDYRITGVNRSLKVQHRGAVQRFDAGLYETLAKNDASVRDIREFVLKRIHGETERFLQSKSYKQAVELLVDKQRRDELQQSVELRVKQTLQQYGLQLQSFSTVVQDLPERPLLSGWELDLEPKEYPLSVHDRIANLGVIATLKLEEPELIVPHIIQRGDAQADGVAGQTDHLMGLVTRAVEAAIGAYVITITPDQYLQSDLANDQNRAPDGSSHTDKLRERIAIKLFSEFGIALSGAFTLRRGGDPATRRIYELQNKRRNIVIHADKRSIINGQEQSFQINVSYRIEGPSQAYLGIFNSKAVQPIDVQLGDMDAAVEDLFATLVSNAKTMEEFAPARLLQARAGPDGLDAQIMGILAAEHGMSVVIDKFGIHVSLPDQHTATPLQALMAARDNVANQLLLVFQGVPVEDLADAQAKAEQIQAVLKAMSENIEKMQAEEASKRIHGTAVEQQLGQLPPAITGISRPAGPALTDQSGFGSGKSSGGERGASNGAGSDDVIEGEASMQPGRRDQPGTDT